MIGRAKATDKQRGHFISCRFDSINRHQKSIRCWGIVSGIRSLACARATAYAKRAHFVFNMGHGICSLLGAATSKRTTASATTTRGGLGWGEDRGQDREEKREEREGRTERGKRKGDERGKTREEKTGEKRKEEKREERRDRRRDEREKRKED